MSHKTPQERYQEQQTFQNTVEEVANNPNYTSKLSWGARRKLVTTKLQKAFTPQEQAYLRAHNDRRAAFKATREATSQEVAGSFDTPYPNAEDERLWSGQTARDTVHAKRMEDAVADPKFAADLAVQVEKHAGHLLDTESERLLTEKVQAHLYARTGALALANEFGGKRFHRMDLDDVLSGSLRREETEAVRDLLEHDGVLQGDDYFFAVNRPAADHLSEQQIYVPPTPDIPRQ